MDFFGAARPLSEEDLDEVAALVGLEPEIIKAVAEVESRGSGFLVDNRPVILFEAHVFGRLTNYEYNQSHRNISSAKWDKTLYGRTGNHQYDRLEVALDLDFEAALKSASWGRFQIMGFNHKMVGYETVESFVEGIKESERKHLEAFVAYCVSNNLIEVLKRKDWYAFAKGYNGPGHAENQYDTKIALAYERFRKKAVIDPEIKEFQTAVRRIQTFLKSKGHTITVDGDFGERSRSALSAYVRSK